MIRILFIVALIICAVGVFGDVPEGASVGDVCSHIISWLRGIWEGSK